MRTQSAIATLLLCANLSLVALPAAFADDVWFTKYDHNHDGRWDYNEFRKAHHDWARHHRAEKALTDAELRAQWDHYNHDGWVRADDVRTWHAW